MFVLINHWIYADTKIFWSAVIQSSTYLAGLRDAVTESEFSSTNLLVRLKWDVTTHLISYVNIGLSQNSNPKVQKSTIDASLSKGQILILLNCTDHVEEQDAKGPYSGPLSVITTLANPLWWRVHPCA